MYLDFWGKKTSVSRRREQDNYVKRASVLGLLARNMVCWRNFPSACPYGVILQDGRAFLLNFKLCPYSAVMHLYILSILMNIKIIKINTYVHRLTISEL